MMHFLLEALLQRHFVEHLKILQIHALLTTSGFFLLPKPSNTFAFNCLIQSYLRHGSRCLSGLSPTTTPSLMSEATLVSVLSACANLHDRKALAMGKGIHTHIIRQQVHVTAFLGTALIDLYGKHGHLCSCQNIFEATVQREACTWNAMISAFACNGQEAKALKMFDKMSYEGMTPNHVTLVAVLTACSRAGLVDLGLQHFESMVTKYGLIPLMEHYGCVVDLLGRAGLLYRAFDFIEQMPFGADDSVWGALLGACKLHKDAKLGALVAQKLIILEPRHGVQYMTLRNIYAQEERWQDVMEMRETMKLAGAKKVAGMSYVNSTWTVSQQSGIG